MKQRCQSCTYVEDQSHQIAMSSGRGQKRQLAVYVGDLSLMKNFLTKKKNNSPWFILKVLDALFRGYGQVVRLVIGDALMFRFLIFIIQDFRSVVFVTQVFLSVIFIIQVFLSVVFIALFFLFILRSGIPGQRKLRTVLMTSTTRINQQFPDFNTQHNNKKCLEIPDIEVAFANNPISGLLIAGAFTVVVPGMMFLVTCTAILGLFLSMFIGETQSRIENGLTVFNHVLYGAVTHSLTPDIYDSFDGRLFLFLVISVIFSVYLTRAFEVGRLPGLSAPFNIVQLIFIFTLALKGSDIAPAANNATIQANATTVSSLFAEDTDSIMSNATGRNLDWGMVFRGIVTSASQVFALDNVAVSSIIYLAILTYSPITAAFSFAGAMLGSLTGLVLDVPVKEAYSGIWGYNGLLTSAALGGLFVVIGFQTTLAAMFASVFATILQNALTPIFAEIGLPVLSVPSVLTTWLFLGLCGSQGSGFIQPKEITFPEKHRHDFIESQQTATAISSRRQSDASNELDISAAERQALK